MEGTPAIYLGRIVEKKNFRAFIYGANGQKRLAESWEEFEANMESGVWFATLEGALEAKSGVHEPQPKAKAKAKPKPKAKPELEVEDSANVLSDDKSVFEVTGDF